MLNGTHRTLERKLPSSDFIAMFCFVQKAFLITWLLKLKVSQAIEVKRSVVGRKIQKLSCFNVNYTQSLGSFYNFSTHNYDVKFRNVFTDNSADFSDFTKLTEFQMIGTDTGYHFFDSDGNLMSSAKAENYQSSICYDPLDCYYFLVHGHAKYKLHDNDELLKVGSVTLDSPSFFSLGECSKQCDFDELVIAGSSGEEYTLFNDNGIIKREVFVKPTLKKFCFEQNECLKLFGTISYLHVTNDVSLNEGNAYNDVKEFGACSSKCHGKPVLSNTIRGRDILQVITSVSGEEATTDVDSNHYKAACWIIYDDLLQLSVSDQNLLQRYILSLLYFSLNGENWHYGYYFLSPKHECDWFGLHYHSNAEIYANNGIGCNDVSVLNIVFCEYFHESVIILCLNLTFFY